MANQPPFDSHFSHVTADQELIIESYDKYIVIKTILGQLLQCFHAQNFAEHLPLDRLFTLNLILRFILKVILDHLIRFYILGNCRIGFKSNLP